MKQITSTANARIKDIIKLHNSRDRKKTGQIIIEGSREIELALKKDFEILELYYCPEIYTGVLPKITTEIIEVTKPVFERLAYKENPEGLLAVAKSKYLSLADLKLSKQPLVIILEDIEKPGNLGAILRTAYAVKADAIIINSNHIDIYNPNVIRASMGHIFTVPTVIATIDQTVSWLKASHVTSYATAITATKNYTKADYKNGTAIVLGTENSGLSQKWLDSADEQIIIPMQAGMDSLNVSVSTAIIAYEISRQRGFKL